MKIIYYTKEGKFILDKNKTLPYYELHRLDGPAVIWPNGVKFYWINGKRLGTKEVECWIKNNKVNLKTKAGQIMFMLRFK